MITEMRLWLTLPFPKRVVTGGCTHIVLRPPRSGIRHRRVGGVLTAFVGAVFLACVAQAAVAAQTPGLVSEWQGNGNANDSVGTSNGTLVDGGYAPGQNGQQAFNLDGQDDYVTIPSSAMANVTGAISVSAWVKPTSSGGGDVFSQYDTHDTATAFGIQVMSGGQVFWGVGGPSCDWLGGDVRALETTAAIPAGRWTQIAGTFDPGTGQLHILINGIPAPTRLYYSASVSTLCRTSSPLRIGVAESINGALLGFFDGEIQDVQLYNQDISTGGGNCVLGGQSKNISGAPVPFEQVADQAFSGTVAQFVGKGTGPAVDPRNYYATIDWGDGSRPFTNSQPAGPAGNFTVDGSHTYPSSSFPKGYNVVVRLYYQPSGCPAPAKATVKLTGFGLFAPPPQDPLKPLWLLGAVASTAGTAPACVTVVGCLLLGGSVVGIGVAAKDPPDRHFKKVFRPQRFPLPRMTVHCGHLSRAACGRLKQAWKSYDKAVSRVASLSEAIGVTVDRRSGARAAHNAKAQARQAKALQKYQTLWGAAVKGRQAAGLRLGAELTLYGRNTTFSAAQIARGRSRLAHLLGFPSALIGRLRRDGLISGRADLRRLIASLLHIAPPPTSMPLSDILAM